MVVDMQWRSKRVVEISQRQLLSTLLTILSTASTPSFSLEILQVFSQL